MKFLNFTVPNYILYIIGIIVLVSVVFLPVLFTVILPKLQNNSTNSITTLGNTLLPNINVLGNSPLINLPTQYVNTTITPSTASTALSRQSIPPTATEQLIVLNPIL